MRALSRRELADAAGLIAAGGWRQDIADIAEAGLVYLTPPDDISTAQFAEDFRLFRAPEGGGTTGYRIESTPYNKAPMDALDDPGCNLVVMPKPSRSGGTVIAENFLLRMIRLGPMGWVAWYLASDSAVKRYCDGIVKTMFELHDWIDDRIGKGRSDNNEKFKKIAGYPLEYLSAADPNSFTNREPMFMVMDETDASRAAVADKPVTEIRARQKRLGRRRKAMVMSHPDKGWGSGVAAAWVDTSRGIFVMRCVECGSFAAAHATKHWENVPEFRLSYARDEQASRDERLEMAERTAGMVCPHCGSVLDDAQRFAMIDQCLGEPRWMHRGQWLDVQNGIMGTMTPTTDWGFWIHGLMLKTARAGELAKEREAAIIKWETNRRSGDLKTFFARQLGEIYEGTVSTTILSASSLRKRAREEQVCSVGECPAWVRFITAAVDVGIGAFDVSFRGWDLDGRSIWLDRFTIRQRRWADGIMRDIRTRERVEDWHPLYEQVIDRLFPIIGRDGWAMPVAAVAIDVKDGNVVWKGREFARQTITAGRFWGSPIKPWSKVRLIGGVGGPKAPALPDKPRDINVDEVGRRFHPPVQEYSLGVDKLKETVVDFLGVDDGGPGQCLFAAGIDGKYFDQYFNERQVDGKWERFGPNESLDLFAYEIAARAMLKPDRKEIDWMSGKVPAWARPVRTETATAPADIVRPAPPPPAGKAERSLFERFDALNNRPDEPQGDW